MNLAENHTTDVALVHSSDLHVDKDRAAGSRGADGTAPLRAVLATAGALRADVVLLAGDTFENNQLGSAILHRVGGLFAGADLSVVILPGNHDPALADSVFYPWRLRGARECEHSRGNPRRSRAVPGVRS